MKNLIRNNWLSLALIAIGLIWGLLQLSSLPDQVATHFDMNGNADRFSSKYFAAWFMPLMSLFIILVINGLLIASPRSYAAPQSTAGISKLIFGITLFSMSLHFSIIREALDSSKWVFKILPFSLSFFIIVLGNYLGKIEKNFVIGFRLPWTLASDENWKQTHRFVGKIYVVAGSAALILSLFFPANIFIAMGALLFSTVSGITYSYIYYRKHETARQ